MKGNFVLLYTKICLCCKKEYSTINKKSIYCSPYCSSIGIKEKKINLPNTICEECGKYFYRSKDCKHTVCSKECCIKNSKRKLVENPTKGCRKCHCVFCDSDFRHPFKKKTCNHNCHYFNLIEKKSAYDNKKRQERLEKGVKLIECICNNCGKIFLSPRKRRTCSPECHYNRSHGKEKVENTKKTLIERYGVDSYAKTKDYLEKVRKTNLERYGFKSSSQNELIKEKIKKTNLERYKVKSYLATDECKEKRRNYFINNYGIDTINPSQIPEIRKKLSNNLKKNINSGNSHITNHIKNIEQFNDINFIKETFIDKQNEFLMQEFINYFNITYTGATSKKIKLGFRNYPNKNSCIKTQMTILNWIKEFYRGEILNNRKDLLEETLELDIFVPEKNIAIEFNGIMFHSFGKNKSQRFNNFSLENERKNNHLIKTKLCEQKNIKLFHIFENEWLDSVKQEIWKSMIKNSLGLIENKIYARKCEIKEIKDNSYLEFLDQNHLQGHINSKINIGLFYNNELVSIMTFGKSRFNKNYDYELLRFCNKINTNVVGSFSKLLKYFKSNYNGKIISYGNRRWVSINNNVYKKNGGKLVNVSSPNYYYFNDNYNPILYSRVAFQKHKLKDKLENFDPNLTETENMYNNGYRKIYDCGNLVYEL